MPKAGKSQTSMELIAIVAVILLLLIIVSATIIQKNFFTSMVSNVNENKRQCDELSSAIESFSSNPGYSETKVTLLYYAHVEKNNIMVGPCQDCGTCTCNSCNYRGSVRFQSGASSYISDSAGFNLAGGVQYKIKKTTTGVVFCATSNNWC